MLKGRQLLIAFDVPFAATFDYVSNDTLWVERCRASSNRTTIRVAFYRPHACDQRHLVFSLSNVSTGSMMIGCCG